MNYVGGRFTQMRSREVAQELAEKTWGAPSRPRYRSWVGVAEALLRMGYTQPQVIDIMESKLPRWAADEWPARWGRIPAKALVEFMQDNPSSVALVFEQEGLGK